MTLKSDSVPKKWKPIVGFIAVVGGFFMGGAKAAEYIEERASVVSKRETALLREQILRKLDRIEAIVEGIPRSCP